MEVELIIMDALYIGIVFIFFILCLIYIVLLAREND
jgi:hypothetical protein